MIDSRIFIDRFDLTVCTPGYILIRMNNTMRSELRKELEAMSFNEVSGLLGSRRMPKAEIIDMIMNESSEEELLQLYADYLGHGPCEQ